MEREREDGIASDNWFRSSIQREEMKERALSCPTIRP